MQWMKANLESVLFLLTITFPNLKMMKSWTKEKMAQMVLKNKVWPFTQNSWSWEMQNPTCLESSSITRIRCPKQKMLAPTLRKKLPECLPVEKNIIFSKISLLLFLHLKINVHTFDLHAHSSVPIFYERDQFMVICALLDGVDVLINIKDEPREENCSNQAKISVETI